MPTSKQGGLGQELYGDPMGAGGPLHVVRAVAVAGQVVRVVFDEEPVHTSPSGAWDALNPGNYRIEVVSGQATAPQPVGVDVLLVSGPAYAVGNGSGAGVADERGVDVHVDRQLIVGITYRVIAQQVRSLAGGLLGAPVAAEFPGVTRLEETRRPQRRHDLVDLANPPSRGSWLFSGGGDLAAEDAAEGTKKRILRRLTTPKNAFRFLRGYGLGQSLKSVAYPHQLAALKADAQAQVLEEPDVLRARVDLAMDARGLLTVQVTGRTTRGLDFTFATAFQNGETVV